MIVAAPVRLALAKKISTRPQQDRSKKKGPHQRPRSSKSKKIVLQTMKPKLRLLMSQLAKFGKMLASSVSDTPNQRPKVAPN